MCLIFPIHKVGQLVLFVPCSQLNLYIHDYTLVCFFQTVAVNNNSSGILSVYCILVIILSFLYTFLITLHNNSVM